MYKKSVNILLLYKSKTETDINNSNINDSDINNMSLDSKKVL